MDYDFGPAWDSTPVQRAAIADAVANERLDVAPFGSWCVVEDHFVETLADQWMLV